MDVGATLRRAREDKRLTLEQLSRTTKISLSNLRALENNDFERLPAIVYTRGFLRSYAREVGLDPEDTVEGYLAQIEEALALEQAAREPAVGETAMAAPRPERAHSTAGLPSLRIRADLTNVPRPTLAAATLLLLLVGLVVTFVWRGTDEGSEVATAAAHEDVAQAGAVTPASADAARAAHVVDDGLRLELKTTGPCWVSASADRAPALSRLLRAGENETIEAKDEIVLRVGDPSTIDLTVNGAPLRPLGRAGIPVTVEINRDNFRDLLAS